MYRFVRSPIVAIMATLALASACNSSSKNHEATSSTKSDWETEATAGGLRTYAIDWSCEPKQFGASAETKIGNQDEYCEWKTVKTTATAKTCRFTVSFDRSRDFHLNSRGKTPVNSIAAARQLVRDCNSIALSRLKKGQTAGKLCSGIEDGCVSGRNSDPEICDKVRWATGEKYKGNIEFCVDQLTPSDFSSAPKPLMQFGILADIPENCEYSDEEHTELLCTVPPEDDCFSVAGQIRVGLRVVTKAKEVAPPNTSFDSGDIFDDEESTDGSGLLPDGNAVAADGDAIAADDNEVVAPVVPEHLPSSSQCFVP